MPHKLRKIRKFRGTRTVGYGRIGQHRDSGSKGNRKVGRHKHLWSKIVTTEPNYFGKHGFTSPQSKHRVENTINLHKLDQMAKTSEINLTELGYTKLLGTGKITRALTIQVPSASKTAAQKVQEAGGKVITSTSTTEE
ncbi:MAG: uL15 family ribosomal protein [Candidatus Bathyarchaeota archaeon]|nr:uL15 family ribosomal protein [Candidatus Bathyarchaeota archaeon]MDD4325007.1 uL15 family ribosomal protein [Candidatus Bathyarchaeota archaeon]MDI9577835.1 uL15 family ribosomal protein [Thermoproteota archaeon]MDT8781219.1 uL15 family ribosomal protein [Candidatus Bathyarchaeota archaeon]NLD66671.1 50S ribosomal protein L15 [Thermoproteota archaeon]